MVTSLTDSTIDETNVQHETDKAANDVSINEAPKRLIEEMEYLSFLVGRSVYM